MIKRATSGYIRRNDWQSQKRFGVECSIITDHIILISFFISHLQQQGCTMFNEKIASIGDADDVLKAVIVTQNDIIFDLDINMAAAIQLPPWTIMGSRGP